MRNYLLLARYTQGINNGRIHEHPRRTTMYVRSMQMHLLQISSPHVYELKPNNRPPLTIYPYDR